MDFALFPQEVLCKIFSYLPLHEKVRVGRVNKFFQLTSDGILANTKELSLPIRLPYKYESRSIDHMPNVLGKCSANLEKLILGNYEYYMEYTRQKQERVAVLLRHSFSRLIDLEISFHIRPNVLRQIFKEFPQLRRIKFRGLLRYPEFTMDNLESIHASRCDKKSFRSMILCASKLKEFHSGTCFAPKKIIDEYLGHNPQLKTLALNNLRRSKRDLNPLTGYITANFEKFDYFWQLNSLTTLILGSGYLKIDFERMAASFPRLTRLELYCVSVDGDQISHLASLKYMTQIDIYNIPGSDHRFVENGLLDLAMSYTNLVQASFPWTKMSVKTFLMFVSNNPRLSNMTIDRFTERIDDRESIRSRNSLMDELGIEGGTNRYAAIDILQSLVDGMKTDTFVLTINTRGRLCSYEDWSHRNFKSEEVKDFLEELKEKEGIQLVVSLPKFGCI